MLEAPVGFLYLLLCVEKGRDGRESQNQKILSVYKSQRDCEAVIEAHNKNGKSQWGFKLNETDEFKILEVPREITFGVDMPSWADEMNNLEEMLSDIMKSVSNEKPQKEQN